jgi:hypothetical protein
MSKLFLAMRGATAPFKSLKQKGVHPPSGNPLMNLLDKGWRRKKIIIFLSTFRKRKTLFGA